MTDYQTIMPLAAAITAVGGAWLTVRKIAKDAAKSKKELADEILQQAKEEDAQLKSSMEARVAALETALGTLEVSVNKDIEHLKETYANEIKNLGEKIEALRDQLNSQHSQLVNLLTEMIKKKN